MKKNKIISLKPETLDLLKARAEWEGRSVKNLIERIILAYIEKLNPKK